LATLREGPGSTGKSGISWQMPTLHLTQSSDSYAVVAKTGDVRVFHRTRPEWWWGIFYLPESWLTLALTLALLYSLHRDWKGLARGGAHAGRRETVDA
jgi:hypothetical protein